jgi:hypothetical protein
VHIAFQVSGGMAGLVLPMMIILGLIFARKREAPMIVQLVSAYVSVVTGVLFIPGAHHRYPVINGVQGRYHLIF